MRPPRDLVYLAALGLIGLAIVAVSGFLVGLWLSLAAWR